MDLESVSERSADVSAAVEVPPECSGEVSIAVEVLPECSGEGFTTLD